MSQETRLLVEDLVRKTKLSNAQIATKLKKSKRLIRLYANPIRNEIHGVKIPKILLFDLETAPIEVYVWRLFQNYVQPQMIVDDKGLSILSWSAKWLFDNQIYSQVVDPQDAIDRKDKKILRGLWKLVDQADIVIAHNGKAFDVKLMNQRLMVNGYSPPSPYQMIDTLKESYKAFKFPSHQLEYMNRVCKLRNKIETGGFKLWKDCVHGNTAALKKMVKYNRHDVTALEEFYVMIRPWIINHPNYSIYMDLDYPVCTRCGETKLKKKGFYYTPAGKYQAYRCTTCMGFCRAPHNKLSTSDRKNLLRATAR